MGTVAAVAAAPDAADLETRIADTARDLARMGDGEGSSVYRMSWWSERMLGWAMDHPEFRAQLFRFVDVFPALRTDAEVARHLAEYFDGVPVPRALDLGIGVADRVPFGRRVEARVARRNILRMAQQFIVGATPGDAVEGLHALWRAGSAFTVRPKLVLVVNEPSLTVTVIVAVPVCPVAGVTVMVRLEPEPPKAMPLLGTNVGFEEVPDTVRLPAEVSWSLTVKLHAPVELPAVMV